MTVQTNEVPVQEPLAAPIDAGVRIGHVHLKVADLDRALAFYCGVLGFQVMQRFGDQAAFISAGGYHHHIGLNTWESRGGPPAPPGTTGLYHLAILYPTRAKLADALRRLIAAEIPLEGASDHGVSEALVSARPRRQRRRALLGPAARDVAAHGGRATDDVYAAARSDGAVGGSGDRWPGVTGSQRSLGELPLHRSPIKACQKNLQSGTALFAKRVFDNAGIAIQEREQNACWSFWRSPSLLPVSQRARRDPDGARKCCLRKPGSPPHRGNVDRGGNVNPQSGHGLAARVGDSFTKTLHNSVSRLFHPHVFSAANSWRFRSSGS